MKGQTNILCKTILMELTKEEMEEKESNLRMNCWQMAKNIAKSKGGGAGEALRKETESSLLYLRQCECASEDRHVAFLQTQCLVAFCEQQFI